MKFDAKVFDELVFDVNSVYFENHKGYHKTDVVPVFVLDGCVIRLSAVFGSV